MKKGNKKSNQKSAEFDFRTIQTIQDAFKRKEISFESVKELENFLKTSLIPERFHGPLVAVFKLFVGHEAINDTWKVDYTNYDQPKYFPWAKINSSGSGFVFPDSYFYCTLTHTVVGSRLCNESPEKTNHAFKQFEEEYKKFWF